MDMHVESKYKPVVSIVLPVYNAAAFVKSTIESVLNQTFTNYELIVVDDGSVDATALVVKSYGDKLHYFWKENGGQSSARNVGIKMARGDYVAFIDHDDLWVENKLELQLKEMDKAKDVGLVTCGTLNFSANGELNSITPKVNSLGRRDVITKLLYGNFIGSCSKVIVRARCFKEVGLFDESMRMAEDWDMWFRIAKSCAIRSVELPLVRYRIHETNFSSLFGEINLSNELVLLNRMFADPSLRMFRVTKNKAFSLRYLSAAFTFRDAGENEKIGKCLWAAFRHYPLILVDLGFVGLLNYLLKVHAYGASRGCQQ